VIHKKRTRLRKIQQVHGHEQHMQPSMAKTNSPNAANDIELEELTQEYIHMTDIEPISPFNFSTGIESAHTRQEPDALTDKA